MVMRVYLHFEDLLVMTIALFEHLSVAKIDFFITFYEKGMQKGESKSEISSVGS